LIGNRSSVAHRFDWRPVEGGGFGGKVEWWPFVVLLVSFLDIRGVV